MFDKWYKDLVKQQLKGTGYEAIFFMSYRQVVYWNLCEVITIMYGIVFILSAINPIYGGIAGNIAFYVLAFIWAKSLNAIMFKHHLNCWYTPEPEESELKKLYDKLDE